MLRMNVHMVREVEINTYMHVNEEGRYEGCNLDE